MIKRGLTKSFREKKVIKNINHHPNSKNEMYHLQTRIQSSFQKGGNRKYPPAKPTFVIRKRNTSLLNPDVKNKQNKNSIIQEEKKERYFHVQKEIPFEETKANLVEKPNHWFKENDELYKTQQRRINQMNEKEERAQSVRSKNKSKNKKINECKTRKVIWGNAIPFQIGISRIIETEKPQNQIESLQQLYQMIEKSEK